VARRYDIAGRLLRRWKQELAATAPAFVTVQITDAAAQSGAALTAEGTVA
jgi:predicted lysophospholipase L1 biosynthesis ABC-type transport system permease subunit